MGQYHYLVNLDKREFIDPHELGCGLKLGEQFSAHGPASCLLFLLNCSIGRGGGDIHPEYHPKTVRPYIGRWVGDRVCWVGDYTEKGDIPGYDGAEFIYSLCNLGQTPAKGREKERTESVDWYKDRAKGLRESAETEEDPKRKAQLIEGAEDYERKAETYAAFNLKKDIFKDISKPCRTIIEREVGGKFTKHPKYGITEWKSNYDEPDDAQMRPDMVISTG